MSNKRHSKQCKNCNKLFDTNFAQQQNCSRSCSNELQKKRNSVVLACSNCLKLFQRTVGRIENKIKHYGYDKTFCCRKCNTDFHSKENHFKWKKDRNEVGKKERLRKTLEMKEWRKKVYSRDGYRCQLCHSNTNIEAHHIKPIRYKQYMHNVNNGITLCNPCHKPTIRKEELFEDLFFMMLEIKYDTTLTTID